MQDPVAGQRLDLPEERAVVHVGHVHPQACRARELPDAFSARIEVRAVKGKPGWYEAVAYLRPHFQLETLSASMRLVAEVPKKA